ncbi:MAG TPA: glycosyltransferase 87 family protein [Chryseolinea sp.]|nr:glycosyltransferase 87 family protein [Chryseolinea sp.]
MHKPKAIEYFLFVAFLSLYIYIGYEVSRHETGLLFSAYFAAFAVYVYLTLVSPRESSVDFWFYGSIVLRALFLFSIPNLSDDIYRFIWDGRLLASGNHPFAQLPIFYIDNNVSIQGIDEDLFTKLNSPEYFTVYPALSQYVFWLAASLSPNNVNGSVLVIKIVMFTAEIGSLFLIRRLVSNFNLPPSRVLLYALNPLIIIELVGNSHLEALMIFFVLLAIVSLNNNRDVLSAVGYAAAICVKIIPVIFLPVLIQRLGWRKGWKFCIITGITALVIFIPLFDQQIISGFYQSIGYYFNRFEFNASLYYIVRWLGWIIFGFNIIQYAGIMLACLALLLIIRIASHTKQASSASESIVDQDVITQLMIVQLIYLLFTTTVHPWYLSMLLMLAVLTEFKFVLLWTAMIYVTYAGYTTDAFRENLWLTAIEYAVVLGYLAYEIIWERKYFRLSLR